jgi:hypothetical protein
MFKGDLLKGDKKKKKKMVLLLMYLLLFGVFGYIGISSHGCSIFYL